MQKMPHARKSGLIVKEADGEILIYDEHNDKAHCLNATAAKVWQHCDGRSTIADTCTSLSGELDSPVDENIVWYAIDQFSRDNLLEEKTQMPAGFITNGMNRRQMVRTLGLAAVIALPLVTTILAPTAAQAATLVPPGGACCTSAQCTPPASCFGAGAGCSPAGVCT